MPDNFVNQPNNAVNLISRASALAPMLAERAQDCELLRHVPEQTLEDFHQAGLFRAIQPKRVGGAEMTFASYFEMFLASGAGHPKFNGQLQ